MSEDANRTVMLLPKPSLRELLSANARALVESEYSWDEIGKRFEDLVARIAYAGST